MTDEADKLPSGIVSEVVGETAQYTFHELCVSYDVDPEWVAALVEQGAIEPIGPTRHEWRFTALSAVRVAKAKRLERDLSLNPPGLALALELLDEVEALRARVRSLEEQARR
jgi:chaperone modulatory protein CbpM